MSRFFKHGQLLMATGLVAGLVAMAAAQSEPAGRGEKWTPITALLEKFKNQPLENVKRVAEQGDPQAEHYWAYCLVEGVRVAKDPGAGVQWYGRALQNGWLPSANNLGTVYERGLLGSVDLDKAFYYYNYAASRGLAQGQVNLGMLYLDGKGVPRDPVTAMKWFRLAADQGHLGAMVQLYFCYYNGWGANQDYATAEQWLRRAAEANDPYAQCLLGYLYENPEPKGLQPHMYQPEPDWAQALHWYQRSANQGWAGGQYHLGLLYLSGRAVELDEERALELIRAAADQGLNDALIELARLYARGIGEPRSEADRPFQLFLRAGAGSELAVRYDHGLGTARDVVEAARWKYRAWLAGSELFNLPDLVQSKPQRQRGDQVFEAPDGHEVTLYQSLDSEPSDGTLQALSFYLKAALGDMAAAEQIGELYLAGRQTPQSPAKAWIWFALAAKNGASGASAKLAEAEARLTPDSLSEARRQLVDLTNELDGVASQIRNLGGQWEP